jgi:diacylglycerol O-acyltransferase / wax synthase
MIPSVPQRERMSSVDTAWLRMDSPHNLMMIAGVLMLERRVNFARLRKTIAARLLRYRRFRQCVVEDATGAWWEDDARFDLKAHVQRVRLRGAADKAELERFVAAMASQPLDRSRPLWQFQLVENFGSGSALVIRIHHCIADGIALIGVMLSLTDATPEAPLESEGPAAAVRGDEEGNFLSQLFEPLTGAAMQALKLSGSAWSQYVDVVTHPDRLVDLARHGAALATDVARLALMPDDTRTRFKGRPGGSKRVAWSDPLPLDEVKAAGKVLGCSVNDVLLSCVTGALRGYLRDHGDPIDGVELRALVPVNLRQGAQVRTHTLGNRFGLVALVLPVWLENPLARLYEVGRRMLDLKGSYQAAVTLGVLALVGLCPKPVQRQILDTLASKATAVMTNVPGPQHPLYLAGARITQQMFWVPQSGDIGMGVSILSYDGKVQFGLVTDRDFVPDPRSIVARFAPEFEKLLLTVLMEPWDEMRDPAAIERDLKRLAARPAKSGRPARAAPRPPRRAKKRQSPRKIAEIDKPAGR